MSPFHHCCLIVILVQHRIHSDDCAIHLHTVRSLVGFKHHVPKRSSLLSYYTSSLRFSHPPSRVGNLVEFKHLVLQRAIPQHHASLVSPSPCVTVNVMVGTLVQHPLQNFHPPQ